ncbi:MAG: cytochrome c oxidase subunit II [Verrucomicrobia bacterium]|nr:cytochrome c oxidase subunit II [Verrucomicrobiota bacterium]
MIQKIKDLMSFPPLTSLHGEKVDDLILYVHYLMGALFLVWIVYFVYVLFRFRSGANPKASYTGYTGHVSTYMEVGVAVIEGILLVGLAIPLWRNAADEFPQERDAKGALIVDKEGKPAVTVVRVTAQQFNWNFRYPGKDGFFGKQDLKFVSNDNKFGIDPADPNAKDDVTPPLGEMAVPVNKPVIIRLTSMDVIHNYAVHPMRIMQDAIPGVSIATHFTPLKEGKYQITCAQLCGNSHYFMKGALNVLSQDKYDAWLAEKSKGAATTLE